MSAEPLVVLGRGEHARVILDAIATDDRWRAIGVVGPADDASREGTHPDNLAADLGDDDAFLAVLAAQPRDDRPAVVVGVGAVADPDRRREIVARYDDLVRWATVVHGAATVAPSATVEPGAVVLAAAVLGPNARIGAHAIVNSGAIVEHDVVVGPFAQIAPGAVLGGAVRVGEGALIGLGARVRDHLSIGSNAVVGMGAVVVEDVEPATTVVGVPARPRTRTGAGT